MAFQPKPDHFGDLQVFHQLPGILEKIVFFRRYDYRRQGICLFRSN